MLNLAILALAVLVVGTLWLLLRSPVPIVDEGAAPDDVLPAEGGDPAEPPGHRDAHVGAPPQSDERPPNH